MNSEKSYDSLPNFTAADCEFFVFQFYSLPGVVCNLTLAFSLTVIYTWHKSVWVFVTGLQLDSIFIHTQAHTHNTDISTAFTDLNVVSDLHMFQKVTLLEATFLENKPSKLNINGGTNRKKDLKLYKASAFPH